ncbi:MAG TPA: aromatic amino acid ammonia-lyase [Polyangiaceae bacterium]|nr:aromatic amino acid ammonia-lyase [Polyangiaceae bacterium]
MRDFIQPVGGRAVSSGSVTVGVEPLTIESLVAIALDGSPVRLDASTAYAERLESGVRLLREAVERGERIYGITTGFGDSCVNVVALDEGAALARNLIRYHNCGTGNFLDVAETRAVIAARLGSISRGHSAVRPVVLHMLVNLLNHDIAPCIPEEGSVGASGDLTPLSYVAATIAGEGTVRFGGARVEAADALRRAGLRPVALEPRESLALMNGTSAMTGIAALGFRRAQLVARAAAAVTAMAVEAMDGDPGQYDDRIFAFKPHPGQRAAARWIREDLDPAMAARDRSARLQDRYSLRCAPHVIGVLADVLPLSRQFLEVEVNSVNDNPIIDLDTGDVLRSGNFYGGHVAQASEMLKTGVANIADLLDRQLALLCNPATNNGLSRDLVRVEGRGATAHHGFKAMQITASALTAEALKMTLPASVFSRSTESHNQDKVSMGTIAARDLRRILELTENVTAIHLLALCQAIDLRGGPRRGARTAVLHDAVRALVPPLGDDRPMDVDIRQVASALRHGELPVGELDFG